MRNRPLVVVPYGWFCYKPGGVCVCFFSFGRSQTVSNVTVVLLSNAIGLVVIRAMTDVDTGD